MRGSSVITLTPNPNSKEEEEEEENPQSIKSNRSTMQELFGSVRKSLIFRPSPNSDESPSARITKKIGSCLRKSRIGLGLGLLPRPISSPPISEESAPSIRWRKGELIGCGAFGHVYMGMNLDSGELLAVKQVLIGASSASKEKAQSHIKELEEEVNLLKNLSHPNIVRYLGTSREEDTLNILLEFVPGGSISSLLGKLGSFPEAVIKKFTRQLLQGLEYLHRNKIMHRDIKGANILVDNKGRIKLADFGASKQVAKLATMTAAKSMKGTPYWMAPEVIVQSGHSFSADIWSVGCTVIEMATGKPPWSQQYQEVAALFHVGTTKSHPPIPEHLSSEAKDFLLKCLQEEPNLRPTASDLLQHPFIAEEYQDSHPLYRSSATESSPSLYRTPKGHMMNNLSPSTKPQTSSGNLRNSDYGGGSCSTISHEYLGARPLWATSDSGDMCRFDDEDDFPVVGSSFNPMSEPFDDWSCKFNTSSERRMEAETSGEPIGVASDSVGKYENDFSFPRGVLCEDDDEVTETKIRAFLEEKALDLKKLQTPLYEEFLNTSKPFSISPDVRMCKENITNSAKFPPKSNPSPSKVASGPSAISCAGDMNRSLSSGDPKRRVSNAGVQNIRILKEISSPSLNKREDLLQDSQLKPNISPSGSTAIFSERQRKWKEELDQELEREREMMRQAGVVGGKTSPNDRRGLNRKRDHLRFT